MYNYNKSEDSPYDPTKLAIYSNLRPEVDLKSKCGQNFKKKTVSFEDTVHFTDEENIVTYVDSGSSNTLYPETPTKAGEINREQNYISRSCWKPMWIPSNDQHNCSIDERHASRNLWTCTIYGTWFQQLLCHSTALMIENLCPISTLDQQLTNLEQTHIRVFSSFWMMDSKRKTLSVSFAFFRRNYLPDGLVNETVATIEELSDLWKPGARDGIPPFVMNCSFI